MKILGLDYGTKRLGIAISDENSKIAFPHSVLKNDANLIYSIKKIKSEENFNSIVVGDPGENNIKEEVLSFVENLKKAGFDVFLEKEFMTSVHSDMFENKKPIARQIKKKKEFKKDESAAALILQRFLDKNK